MLWAGNGCALLGEYQKVVCVKLCKKVFMVSVASQAAIFKSSFFCSANRLMLR
jgi:hypothetical protein